MSITKIGIEVSRTLSDYSQALGRGVPPKITQDITYSWCIPCFIIGEVPLGYNRRAEEKTTSTHRYYRRQHRMGSQQGVGLPTIQPPEEAWVSSFMDWLWIRTKFIGTCKKFEKRSRCFERIPPSPLYCTKSREGVMLRSYRNNWTQLRSGRGAGMDGSYISSSS